MKNKFVEGVSNVTRFTNATRSVDARGAQEAGWHLATGMPGFGKSGTVGWYAMQSKAVFIRCKAAYTPHWLLADIAESLNVESKIHSTEKLFKAVLPVLMERYNADGSRLIVDEINHACHNGEVIEILRCLTDGAEMPLIVAGHTGTDRLLKRWPQIYSRIAEVTVFGPASVEDVRLICNELSTVKIAANLVEAIHRRTGGNLRSIKNAIARVEHAFRRERDKVTLEMWGNRPLTTDERVPQLQIVKDAVNG